MNRFTSGWVTGKQQTANFQYILCQQKEKKTLLDFIVEYFLAYPLFSASGSGRLSIKQFSRLNLNDLQLFISNLIISFI